MIPRKNWRTEPELKPESQIATNRHSARGNRQMPGRGRPFTAGNSASKGIGRRGKNPAKQLDREIERRWIEDITAAAKQDTDLALATLRGALLADNCPWSSKITAAEAILNRGWGKPKEIAEQAHRITIEDLVLAGMRHIEEEDRKRAGELPN
jgi:hypothetical protein